MNLASREKYYNKLTSSTFIDTVKLLNFPDNMVKSIISYSLVFVFSNNNEGVACMSKIVFLDIDGTILNTQHEIPETTKMAVKALQEKGIVVAIATGRAPYMFRDIRKELNIDTYVSFNGQFAVFNNKPVLDYKVDMLTVESLRELALENGHSLVYMSTEEMVSSVKHDPLIESSLGSLNFDHPRYEEDFYLYHPLSQLLLFCQEGEEEAYAERISDYKFVRWHKYAVDIILKRGSKAQGIEKLVEVLGFDMKDTYAFGDGLNDIEMLQTVGTGIAMGNAQPELKQHADLVTKHVDEDGILHGLKEVGLIK